MSSPSPNQPGEKKIRRAVPAKVHLYAEFLGIDLDRHPYLYDLMEEGLRCPLPAGWSIRHLEPDQDGTPCHEFAHAETGRTSNAHPMDEVFAERARALMRKHAIENAASSPALAAAAARKRREAQGGVSELVSRFVGSDDDAEPTAPPSATASNSATTATSTKKSAYRSSRQGSSGGKQARYLLYCFVFAVMIYMLVYSGVFKLVMQLLENHQHEEAIRRERNNKANPAAADAEMKPAENS